MPTVHLTKVAYGCADLEVLKQRLESRAVDGEVRVRTRTRPRRADEVLAGGKLHWIIKHQIIARLAILRLEDRPDGHIDIVCSSDLELVAPLPRRAHQGWRYLEDKDAPGTDDDGTGLSDLPPQLYGRLAALALV